MSADMTNPPSAGETLFWELAEPLLTDPAITRGTMMGYPCLRVGGAFFACVERNTGHLVVKLPAARVTDLITAGDAIPFSPAGRVFREWAACPEPDPLRWAEMLVDARAFALRPPGSRGRRSAG